MPGMRYLVYGRVQGVGFRFFVEAAAQRLGLIGWVRNRSDGGVEALAIGPRVKLQQLEAQLRRGPSASRVENVHTEAADVEENAAGGSFVIEGDA
ncbi:MAG: acylphosphatase [Terriglobales bacterium]